MFAFSSDSRDDPSQREPRDQYHSISLERHARSTQVPYALAGARHVLCRHAVEFGHDLRDSLLTQTQRSTNTWGSSLVDSFERARYPTLKLVDETPTLVINGRWLAPCPRAPPERAPRRSARARPPRPDHVYLRCPFSRYRVSSWERMETCNATTSARLRRLFSREHVSDRVPLERASCTQSSIRLSKPPRTNKSANRESVLCAVLRRGLRRSGPPPRVRLPPRPRFLLCISVVCGPIWTIDSSKDSSTCL